MAIDGPSGAGKTAAGMLVAEHIGAVFVDTGIFYRGLTLLALREGVSMEDSEAVMRLTDRLASAVVEPASGCRVVEVRIQGISVGEAIRSAEVESRVSQVAGHASVRSAVLDLQRGAAGGEPAVVAGRDIGTVIFPEAPLKIYLDASPTERALRRARQLGVLEAQGNVAASLAARDAGDTGRAVAPLARAADAVVVDTDGMSLEVVVDELEGLVRRALERLDA
jgi:CMP/dCMP kinase